MECEKCQGRTPERCAACLEGPPLDRNGRPILPDERVFVPARPGIDGLSEVSSTTGFVIFANSRIVEIEEFGTFHRRSFRPDMVIVKRESTKAAREHRLAVEKLRGTTQGRGK